MAMRDPDISGALTMNCLGNVSDIVRVGVWVSPPLSLTPEQMEALQEETDCFLRRIFRELAEIPARG
ncbi:MAG: hypothetical protein LKJ94_07370 [Candidatus Methanomethylophilus sp.]|jgi:hypothetical protein|nr:hypothetical protein [Methanomethylophilus sp.]MCI2075490.1 hypothetical protein [Methanomethylophilus sp.]MCI2093312.1 hypothetical protein [Methanomethylophilus sp.]